MTTRMKSIAESTTRTVLRVIALLLSFASKTMAEPHRLIMIQKLTSATSEVSEERGAKVCCVSGSSTSICSSYPFSPYIDTKNGEEMEGVQTHNVLVIVAEDDIGHVFWDLVGVVERGGG